MKKRFLSILLTAVLLFCAVPLGLGLVDTAYAAETANSGTCGDNVTWSLSDDGVLTISGTGDMENYSYYDNCAPWYSVRSQVKSVIIERGVTSIGDYAFSGCSALTGVTIPGSVTSIGDYAFSGCSALTSVTIPDGVTYIGYWAFSDCDSLTSVTIPGSVTKIGGSVFYDCDALTDIYYDGYGIDWLKVDGSLSSLTGYTVRFKEDMYGKGMCGENVSWVMTADGTLTISGTGEMADYGSLDDSNPWDGCRKYIKSVVIEDGVTGIGRYAFDCCMSLTSVTIPDSVTAISNYAFRDSTSLTSVIIPSSVTSIGWDAFSRCSSLKSVNIPSSVTSIDGYAFSECTGLTSVTIPNSVTTISGGAFSGCTSLTSVTIPDSVTDLGTYTFFGCGSLTEIKLPSALETIRRNVFSNCVRLTSVTIPKSVTYIEEKAFYYCDSLTDIYYAGTASDWAKITIEDGNEPLTNATLHCAKSAPAAPVVKIGNSSTSGKPMLTWNAVEGATSYRIYRSTAKGSGYSLLGTTTATSYTNTGAKAGTTYYYRVKAVNDAGLSAYSNIVSGQVKTVTPKPSAPVVKIGNSAASGKPMLTWNTVSGATSYKVYRATSQNGTYSLLGTVTATSYTNTGAKAGVTYYYKVKAVNSAGESAYSNVVSGKTTVTTLTMGHSSTSGKPQLTWKAVSGAASYKVYRATTKNGAYSVINTTKALTYTNVGAALGTTYYYKVEALNAAGKSMGFSAIVEGKVAPVLAVGYSSVSGKPQLTWKAVPGATEYQVYRSTQQNSGYSKINTTTSTSYVNTGAKAGTTYYYKIVAVKGTAVSDFSNIVSARPGK